jgi:hypothetical protein
MQLTPEAFYSISLVMLCAVPLASQECISSFAKVMGSIAILVASFRVAQQQFSAHGRLHRSHAADVVILVLSATLSPWMWLDLKDLVLKHRAFGFHAMCWRISVPNFCGNMQSSVVAVILITIGEIYATRLGFQNEQAEVPSRLYVTLICLSAMFLRWTQMQLSRTEALEKAHQELADEKHAQETLVSMLCDSCVELGTDGDTVIRSTPHLDTLLQQKVEGCRLSSFLPSDESEQKRVSDAFQRARTGPIALPVTLLSKKLQASNLDLFMVRRRARDSKSDVVYSERGEEHGDFGFLVGFQVKHDDSASSELVQEEDCAESSTTDRQKFDADTQNTDDVAMACFGNYCPVPPALSDLSAIEEPLVPSCLPAKAVVWIENHSFPTALSNISPGERVLCFDNLGQGVAYATVTSACPATPKHDLVVLTLDDGAIVEMTADHPVTVHTGKASECIRADELQSGQHSVMVMRLTPCLVSRVDHVACPTQVECDSNQITDSVHAPYGSWMTIAVHHPERFEPLIASRDSHGTVAPPIAVGSCNRDLDTKKISTKNTFLCIDPYEKAQVRKTSSAPPSVMLTSSAVERILASSKHRASSASSRRSSSHQCASTAGGDDCSSGLSSYSSQTGTSAETNAKVKIGQTADIDNGGAVALSDVLRMKDAQILSMGSTHCAQAVCNPCSFHFTYVRSPLRKGPCKASYLCEYCHDGHGAPWRSKLRKSQAKIAGAQAKAPSIADGRNISLK